MSRLPRTLSADELGVLPATAKDSFKAGWWALTSQWAIPLQRVLFTLLAVVCVGTVVALPVIDSRPWLPHLVNTTALFLLAVIVVYALSVGVYERARRSAHADMYVSADRDAVLVIERDVVNEGHVYRPRQHTVRKPGEGQGSRMRDEVVPRLAAIVDGIPGAIIQINPQNAAVKKIYLKEFEEYNLNVDGGGDNSTTITYPAQTTQA